jgi:hypothetical protein
MGRRGHFTSAIAAESFMIITVQRVTIALIALDLIMPLGYLRNAGQKWKGEGCRDEQIIAVSFL